MTEADKDAAFAWIDEMHQCVVAGLITFNEFFTYGASWCGSIFTDWIEERTVHD